MRIIECENYAQVCKTAANIVAAQLLLKPDCVLGLPTGNTPIGMYKELSDKCSSGEVDFSEVTTFNLDEYCGIKRDDPNSYYAFMNENLYSKVNLKPENTHIPNGENPDFETETARYENAIDMCGGLDLQVLGIGQNGHIGFNEPNSELCALTNKVALTENTLEVNSALFENPADIPTTAYTMGMGTIMKARRIIMLASGTNKVDAVSAILNGTITTQNPSSMLLMHPDFVLIADKAALGK